MNPDTPPIDSGRSRASTLFVVLLVVVSAGSATLVSAANATVEDRDVPHATDVGEFTPGADSAERPARDVTFVDSCGVIDEPGRYVLTEDLQANATCIHVRASDVVFDGHGHEIAGNRTADSQGILVYNGTPGQSVDEGDSLSNVTVRNVVVSDWETGVKAGDVAGIGTRVALRNVVAVDNANAGVSLSETESSRLVDVVGNDRYGLYLAQNVGQGTFADVVAYANGANGIYLSDDVENNTFAGGIVAGNDGDGIRFADSFDNAFEEMLVKSNAGHGIHLDPGRNESFENTTVRENGGAEIRVSEGTLDSSTFTLGRAIRVGVDRQAVNFGDETPFALDTVPVTNINVRLPGDPVGDDALDVTGVRSPLRVQFDFDAASANQSNATLQQFDGGWTRVPDATTTATAVSGTVSGDGLVLPINGRGAETEGNESETERNQTLEIFSTGDDRLEYEIAGPVGILGR